LASYRCYLKKAGLISSPAPHRVLICLFAFEQELMVSNMEWLACLYLSFIDNIVYLIFCLQSAASDFTQMSHTQNIC